jgi:probable phosphoglycerate mutase
LPTRILLLRHAETSAPDRFHGAESDIGLSPLGRDQASAVARRLAAIRPDALACSAMRRALETAAPIAEACGLEVEVIPALHERRMGPLSGRLLAEGWDHYHAARLRWMAGDLDATHEGGESYAQVRDRVLPPFLDLAARNAGRTTVVVAHGFVIRVLLTSLLDGYAPADFDRIAIEHVVIHELLRDGLRWRGVARDGPAGL